MSMLPYGFLSSSVENFLYSLLSTDAYFSLLFFSFLPALIIVIVYIIQLCLLQSDKETVAKATSFKSRFITYAAVVRWLATNGLRLFIQFWYARTAVFRLPISAFSSTDGDAATGARLANFAGGKGWAPRLVEWIVGFPRVKERGGVSVQVWGWVCVVVVGLLSDGLMTLVAWMMTTTTTNANMKDPAKQEERGAEHKDRQGIGAGTTM